MKKNLDATRRYDISPQSKAYYSTVLHNLVDILNHIERLSRSGPSGHIEQYCTEPVLPAEAESGGPSVGIWISRQEERIDPFVVPCPPDKVSSPESRHHHREAVESSPVVSPFHYGTVTTVVAEGTFCSLFVIPDFRFRLSS